MNKRYQCYCIKYVSSFFFVITIVTILLYSLYTYETDRRVEKIVTNTVRLGRVGYNLQIAASLVFNKSAIC